MKYKTLIFFSFILATGCARREFLPTHKYEDVSNLNQRIRNVLNEDWIIVSEKFTTSIYFCPSCNIPDSNSNNAFFPYSYAESQLKLIGADSVAFLTAVNRPSDQSDDELRESRRPEGILKITIQYEKTWSNSKFEKVKNMNDTLIAELKRKGQTPDKYSSFLDFRANIPDSSKWHKYINEYDFYFQRLPYESSITSKSILINGELPNDWTFPFYIDKSDPLYYLNNSNNMDYEYMRVMYSIAYSLGIEDYKYPL